MRTAARACILLSLGLSLGLPIPSFGQPASPSQPAAPPTTLRITVTLVQVDAVVTDSHGRHIPDLHPEDFEVLQDGEPQKLVHFAYVPGTPPGGPAIVADPKRKRLPGDAPDGPPPPVTATQVKRTVALVVDDLALSYPSMVTVRDSLKKYIEQVMQPGDLVALVRTGGGIAILEQFTTDKRVLLEAADLLKWRFSGRAGLLPIQPVAGSKPPAEATTRPEVLDYGYTLSALGTLSTIEQVIDGMKGLPGRKSVVFFSEDLRVDSSIDTAINRLTDLSNRAAVSIYTIDPGGLRVKSRRNDRDVAANPRVPSDSGFPPFFGSDSDENLQAGLTDLASRTGGIFYRNRNDIPDCIREATDDQLGYYLLAYSPREGTFEKSSAKPKFHKVAVRVLRSGLQVRWKSGFNGVPDDAAVALDARPVPKTREQQILEALASPFTATGLRVKLTSMFTEALDETHKVVPVVHSFLQFDAKGIGFTHDPDGMWRATVDIVTSAYRGVKQPVQQRQRVQAIALTDDQYRQSMKDGFLYVLDDRTKEPGSFLMRVALRDRASERVGSASQMVQVPNIWKGELALSGLLLNLAEPDQIAAVAPPAWGARPKPPPANPWTEGGPALRRYLPSQDILYRCMILNAKRTGSAKQFRVHVQIRVFRDGTAIYTSEPHSLPPDTPAAYDTLQWTGMLRLGPQLTPGEYLLQVEVTDELAGKKHQRATQWIDFEVTPESARLALQAIDGQDEPARRRYN